VKKGDNIVFLTLVIQILLLTRTKIITVSLGEDANLLNEVVIQVGYGTVKKKDLTGAVTVLTSEDFNKGPVTSADQMITGKVAGLQVINGGGSGEGATIRIRSGSSLSANNDPLYVIDNVPVASGGINGGRNPLTTINQNNIESITVLKMLLHCYLRITCFGWYLLLLKGKAGDLQVSYSEPSSC
jgi:iron complex outermembrane receptor protein